MSERELLEQFTSRGSGEAFERLVRGNIDMVYSAARRQVGNAELAEDVTQAVFVLLARKAGKIRGPLAGWLILTTHYCAANAKKLAARREFHERRAGVMRLGQSGETDSWEEYAPMLDAAMARLRQKDRDAVAMRFLQNNSFRDVGIALGISEEAARKRVERSVERLRKILSAKGAAVGAIAAHSRRGRATA